MARTAKPKSKFSESLKQGLERFRFDPGNILNAHENVYAFTKRFDMPGPDMARVTDFDIPLEGRSLKARLYEPHDLRNTPGPAMVFYHGGGFVTCDLDSHDGICRRLALGANTRILSVAYRLAPDHPFPAAVDDARDSLEWVLAGGAADMGVDETAIAVGGDSAGGNLAAHLAQTHRKHIRAQILLYPLLQMIEHHPTQPGPQDVFKIGEAALKFIDEQYVCGADCHDPRLSPLLESDLVGVPPAYILTCGLDPLRIEGRAYAEKLLASGVEVETHYEKGMPHGFLNFAKAFPKARRVPGVAAEFLRQRLHS